MTKYQSVYGHSVRELLGDSLPLDMTFAFVHDVNGALIGALKKNDGLSHGNVALTTLGTGLGFAYSVNGCVRMAPSGSPERSVWNVPYQNGILEDYVSRRAILRFYTEAGGILEDGEDVKEISEKAKKGDRVAAEAFETLGRHYSSGIRDLIYELEIGKIIFAGQIAGSFCLMENAVRKELGESIELIADVGMQKAVFTGALSLVE